MKIRQFVQNYIEKWWMPPLIAFGALGLFLASMLAIFLKLHWDWMQIFFFGVWGVTMLGMLGATGWQFFRKRWKAGALRLLVLVGTAVISVIAIGGVCFTMAFGPSEDGFADHLTIPGDIEITEPLKQEDGAPGGPEDVFQEALLQSLKTPGNGDASFIATAPALAELSAKEPALLKRYLASNPAWRVFREHGNIFATRRWRIGSKWLFTLHGYYTRFELDSFHKSSLPEFQTRLTLGLSGKPWWHGNKASTWIKAGETAHPKLSVGNNQQESHSVIALGRWVLEIFEQSENPERRLTKASLQQLEKELRPLADHPDEATLRAQLPHGGIRQGATSLELWNSFQPGIYESSIWVNPGEPGMIYLKAFEVTKGTPLSVDSLKEESNEWVGWSENPGEQFFSNTNFTIYEGDWGKPYAARFEVWFVPDSGKPERKLLERNFKIEGWMR